MRVAIFGTGGVGGYFGGRLAQAGHAVVFIARGAHLQAIRRDGLRVESVAGDFVVWPAEATDAPAEAGQVDAVLVCTKAWQVGEAAGAMGPLLAPETLVVPLTNGVEAADELASVVGRERVLGGLCRILSYVTGPGCIRHAGVAPQVEFGERHGRTTARVLALRAAFESAHGVNVVVPPDIEIAAWEKFLFIAPLSGIGAVSRLAVGGFRDEPEWRPPLEAAMREVVGLARARGVRLADDAVLRTLAYVDRLPPDTTASMQRDILAGKPSELEAQTGAVVRLAEAAGLTVPVNQKIYETLLPLEQSARGLDPGTTQP